MSTRAASNRRSLLQLSENLHTMSLSQEQIRAALKLGPRPKPQFGHNRSHAMNATKRQFKPNLQTRRVTIDGETYRVKLSAREIRTLTKRGTLLLSS